MGLISGRSGRQFRIEPPPTCHFDGEEAESRLPATILTPTQQSDLHFSSSCSSSSSPSSSSSNPRLSKPVFDLETLYSGIRFQPPVYIPGVQEKKIFNLIRRWRIFEKISRLAYEES